MFIIKLKQADWSNMFTCNCVEQSWLIFQDTFLSVLDSIAPLKEVRLKQRSEPWLDSTILDLFKQKDAFSSQFRKYGKPSDHSKYCSYRNFIRREVKKAKANYISRNSGHS